MRYFDLSDDVHVSGRWHLGEIVAPGHEHGLSLRRGERAVPDLKLRTSFVERGKALDFSLTSFANPVARTRLGDAIQPLLGADVQRLPIVIPGHTGFEVWNALRLVACLDEKRTDFTKWTKDDDRADLEGHYRMVMHLHIRAKDVPPDLHVFRVEKWSIALIVSEYLRERMERAGCLGAQFTEVT